MNNPEKKFYSKILLFGEYTLMFGSEALSIPYTEMFGYFSFANAKAVTAMFHSNTHLRHYSRHLRKLLKKEKPDFKINLERFEQDIDNGLVFESNIPLGYGLGSSGSLVAAIYDRYAENKIISSGRLPNEELNRLKNNLALMESYFHGKSSGLDPLICYLQKPILLDKNGHLKQIEFPVKGQQKENTLFLLDSGKAGDTQPLVNYFTRQCQDLTFMEKIKSDLIPSNHQGIEALLHQDAAGLLPVIKKISAFTFNNLKPMIPDTVTTIWQNGLATDDYYLKLCGSGGGGMMLGFTEDFEQAKQTLSPFTLHLVLKF